MSGNWTHALRKWKWIATLPLIVSARVSFPGMVIIYSSTCTIWGCLYLEWMLLTPSRWFPWRAAESAPQTHLQQAGPKTLCPPRSPPRQWWKSCPRSHSVRRETPPSTNNDGHYFLYDGDVLEHYRRMRNVVNWIVFQPDCVTMVGD